MGAWSEEPFGNDTASDWSWELDEANDWHIVVTALEDALDEGYVDDEVAAIAIAAAEVVAHGLGRGTQDDAFTKTVTAFAARADAPSPDVVAKALAALAAASGPDSGLAELWDESGPAEWREANSRLAEALGG